MKVLEFFLSRKSGHLGLYPSRRAI